jgi:putative membrane protein
VYGLGFLASVLLSSVAGWSVGFITGLVPGLHVNNVAAVTVAYCGSALSAFAVLASLGGSLDSAVLLASCFLVSALVAHSFSEAIPNTYVGIPSGDAITVLPAHRLARAGLGWTAVMASVEGSLAGLLLGALALVPVSFLLGPSVGLYGAIRSVMGYVVVLLSAALVLSDSLAVPASQHPSLDRLRRTVKVLAVFSASGMLGLVVLDTNYFASPVPGCEEPFVFRAALLLPLFAGLFGLPTLFLSVSGAHDGYQAVSRGCKIRNGSQWRGAGLSLIGGLLVGWIPGVTSGSSATLCSSFARRPAEESTDVEGCASFIWLYSAISTSGAVMSVGALFTILRSRSGIMDAVSAFLSPQPLGSGASELLGPASLLLSMVSAAMLSYAAFVGGRDRLRALGSLLCSRMLGVGAMVFIVCLVAVLTGPRGLLLLATAFPLGVLPPLVGVRRIHLMGCLLVPISLMFLA